MEVSGDVFGCHRFRVGEEQGVITITWVEARTAVKCPTIHKTQIDVAENINDAKI